METKEQVRLTDKVVDILVKQGPFLPVELDAIQIVANFNPRKVKGFDGASISELECSIRDHGVLQPPAVRMVDGRPRLVAGERRTRALRNLVARNELVYTDEGFRPASEVYKTVVCRVVVNCTDERALQIAFAENDKHVPLSEGEVLDLCERLEEMGYNQSEVGRLLHKSPAWVSHSFQFRKKLHPEVYEMLRVGRITRNYAQKILEQPAEIREELIALAQKVAEERYEERMGQAIEDVVAADEALVEAEEESGGDEANPKMRQANKAADKAASGLRQVKDQGVVYAAADVDEAVKRKGLSGGKGLTPRAIFKNYVDGAKGLEGSFDARDLSLVRTVATAIAQGSKDLEGVMTAFMSEHPLKTKVQIPVPAELLAKSYGDDDEEEEDFEDDDFDLDENDDPEDEDGSLDEDDLLAEIGDDL